MVHSGPFEGIKKRGVSRRDFETSCTKYVILHNAVRFFYHSDKRFFDNIDTFVRDVFHKPEEINKLV